MVFSVGDKIIHPKFGAGTITGEAHRELVKGFEHYYVINVVNTGATAYIPMGKMDELGVRPVMSQNKLAAVLTTLHGKPRELDGDYKLRQAWVMEQLKTRHPIAVAEAVRDLTWHRHRKRLTQKDESLLTYGRELLANEMALATDTLANDVQQTIEMVLRTATADESDEQAGSREVGLAPPFTPEALVQKHFSGVVAD